MGEKERANGAGKKNIRKFRLNANARNEEEEEEIKKKKKKETYKAPLK